MLRYACAAAAAMQPPCRVVGESYCFKLFQFMCVYVFIYIDEFIYYYIEVRWTRNRDTHAGLYFKETDFHAHSRKQMRIYIYVMIKCARMRAYIII